MIDENNVSVFMDAASQERNDKTARLYLALMIEEVAETAEAEGYVSIARQLHGYSGDIKRGLVPERECDIIGAFDGGLDTVWVTLGYMHARSFPIEAGWSDVARSNMSKTVNGILLKDDNGKAMKGPNYSKPDLVGVLNDSGYFG